MINNKRLKDDLDKIIASAKQSTKKISISILADILYTNEKDRDNSIITLENVITYVEDSNVVVYYENTDIEEEVENYDSNYSLNPFDPSKVDITMKPLTFDLIIKRLENEEIDLLPDFQRKAGLWTGEQKSRLIESLLLRIPLPAFYFDGTNNSNWVIIDGLQRLSAIKDFFVEKSLKLHNLEFLKDFNGYGVDDLTRTHTRRIEETQIIAYIINPGTPDNLKFNIFKRINTGGLKLEPQEIRHALYQGNTTEFLKRLANSEQFKEATYYSVKSERMLDREFVLRFVSFYLLGENKYKGNIDEFLIDGMKLINKLSLDELYDLEKTFYKSMELAYNIFGMYAFRKQFNKSRRNPINKGLFEAWSVELARLTDEQINIALGKKRDIDKAFMDTLKTNNSFVDSLNGSFEGYIRYRFRVINQILRGILG